MLNLTQLTVWPRILAARKLQGIFGKISGLLLTLALVALFDGLLAQIRTGNDTLDLLAGSSITLSGPMPIKNPVASDLTARFTPPSPAPEFQLEGFFTGYWFGSGMWRGEVIAPEDLPASSYELRISFLGSSAQSAQVYKINVYPTPTDLREASYSLFTHVFDLNPFFVAAFCGICGLIMGIGTYIFGRRYLAHLFRLHLAPAYPDGDNALWCFCAENAAPATGSSLAVFTEDGAYIGDAKVSRFHKDKLELRISFQEGEQKPALILLAPDLPKK